MGNLLTVKYSSAKDTRDGRHVYLSVCVYKFEDRDINKYSTREENENSEGGKFWQAFWDLWKNNTKFKTIVKSYNFAPTKRRVKTDFGGWREEWNKQLNHWLPIETDDEKIDPSIGVSKAEMKRQLSFDRCIEELAPIISHDYPQYVEGILYPKTSSEAKPKIEVSYDI